MRFHLVMLMEHFEESLILLKDTLRWEMNNLLFFKLNTREESTVSKLSPELRAKALQWNGIDWKLSNILTRPSRRKWRLIEDCIRQWTSYCSGGGSQRCWRSALREVTLLQLEHS